MIALGLVLVLAVSGAVEAFVTPSTLPPAARLTIGAVIEVAFIVYIVVLGGGPRPRVGTSVTSTEN